MTTLTLSTALLVALGVPCQPPGGAPYEALDAGDVFVATVTRVEDKGATNARPPRVWLKVHEVLRGDAKTVRSPALWSPRFHGYDTGDGNQPGLRRWNATPLKGPQVGKKFILGGRALVAPGEKNEPVYKLFAFVRFPYSDKARADAISTLATRDAAKRKYAAAQAAAARQREMQGQKWRAAMNAQVIDRRTQEADAVAIGRIIGGSTYQIEQMLKGRPRMSSGGKYFVTLPSDGYDTRIADLLDERPRCILFLSEEKLIASVSDIHTQLVHPYEGIVLADNDAIAAVKASLERQPAQKPRPVLVISALDRPSAGALARAARANFTVVVSQQFSAHSSNTVVHVRKTIPHADFLVMIGRAPQRPVVAARITPDGAPTLYEAEWAENDGPEQLQALLRKLVEAAN